MGARVLLALLVLVTCGWSLGQATPAADRPAVLKTVPETLSDNVDPALGQMSVTFDRAMTDQSWSWTGGGDTFPQLAGRPAYDAERKTCTVAIKLEPGKVYWVGINSPSYQNFKSAEGTPARRHVILFATRGEDGSPTPLPDELIGQVKRINGAGQPARPAPTVDSAPAEKAASAWLELVDAARYGDAWEQMDEFARQMADQQAFTGQLTAVRAAMGKLVSRKLDEAQFNTALPGTPDGRYFMLRYQSVFEKKKVGVETVVMSERDGAWKVAGYFIR